MLDMKEVLFRRMLVKPHNDERDEEKSISPEVVCVTKEQNGYALWYSGWDFVLKPRIIAWSQHGKDDVIAYAVTISPEVAHGYADEGICNYNVPSLDKMAKEPVVVPSEP